MTDHVSDWDAQWLFPSLARVTKGELQEMIRTIPTKYQVSSAVTWTTNKARREYIEACRRRFWDDQAAQPRPATRTDPRTTTRKPSLCTITAEECNAWLRSLPPLEFGDELNG